MEKTKQVKMYYHKTDGGAKYLTDKFVRCPDGSKEGVFKNAKYIIRLDGEAELTVVEKNDEKGLTRTLS